MYEKLKDSIIKLKNTTIIAPLIHIYFNTYLLKAVYFGYGIIELIPKQESVLKKLYESTILQKFGLSKNMSRQILYARKNAFGLGLIILSTAIAI